MSHAFLVVALDMPEASLGATGKEALASLEAAIEYQMAPFDENGSWFEEGTRWDWWQIGGRYAGRFLGKDVVLKRDLDVEKLRVQREADIREGYKEAQAARKGDHPMDDKILELVFGVKPAETEDEYIARVLPETVPMTAYAFLRNRNWHEYERMGWWGASAKTECEIAGNDTHICLHEKDGAKIVSWNGAESWDKMFWKRFIEPLPDDTILVGVDYHV